MPEHRWQGRAMGTDATIVVALSDQHLVEAAVAHLAALERRWSRFLADSEISVLNRTPDRPVIVSPDTFALIQAAVDASFATDGLFDPTVHDALVDLGYDRMFDDIEPKARPTAQAAPGVAGIELDDALHAVTLPAGVRLDMGGIGKGTAADLVTGKLMSRGAAGAAVSVGGDTRVRGTSPAGNGWQVTDSSGTSLDLPRLADGGVCTSSSTKRRWATQAGTVHHLIDPRTGDPTATYDEVTVTAATAQQAEVLCKVAMVAGPAAPQILESFGATARLSLPAAA